VEEEEKKIQQMLIKGIHKVINEVAFVRRCSYLLTREIINFIAKKFMKV
jgi:hypothetical protein